MATMQAKFHLMISADKHFAKLDAQPKGSILLIDDCVSLANATIVAINELAQARGIESRYVLVVESPTGKVSNATK